MLRTDLIQCVERQVKGQDQYAWEDLRAFLKREKLYDKLSSSLPPEQSEGSTNVCVAFDDFQTRMHDDCEVLLKGGTPPPTADKAPSAPLTPIPQTQQPHVNERPVTAPAPK